jgi:hypothetical protein
MDTSDKYLVIYKKMDPMDTSDKLVIYKKNGSDGYIG